MAKITVSFPSNALGLPVIHEVGASTEDETRSMLIQVDYDFAGVASAFGWVACLECGETDGTIACAHRPDVTRMLAGALLFLEEHAGEEVEDPGYFL